MAARPRLILSGPARRGAARRAPCSIPAKAQLFPESHSGTALRGAMKQILLHALAAAVSLVAACGGLAAQTSVQFPSSGPVVFTLQVPTGWSSSDDGSGNLALVSSSQGLMVMVSVTNEADVVTMSADAIAQKTINELNATPVYKQVPASISGFNGTAYYSSISSSGAVQDLKFTIVAIDTGYIAMEIVMTPTVITPAVQASLEQVLKTIALKVSK
jgi:hypothetical protein